MPQYHVIRELGFEDGALSIGLEELLEGPPDGFVGLPLMVLPASRKYAVRIAGVGHFVVCPEPVFSFGSNARKLTDFLYEEDDSALLAEYGWGAATFNLGHPRLVNREMRHFVVFADNFVVNVLSASEPTYSEVAKVGT
ncbi:hypothetical protein [Thauera sp.]|uniref:hypothetical protein n=1 Tax=Thauera sp. TaxID=1905334 RepID=UPI0039E53774